MKPKYMQCLLSKTQEAICLNQGIFLEMTALKGIQQRRPRDFHQMQGFCEGLLRPVPHFYVSLPAAGHLQAGQEEMDLGFLEDVVGW